MKLLGRGLVLLTLFTVDVSMANLGISADKLKAVQNVGRQLVAHNTRSSGMSVSQSQELLDQIKVIRGYFLGEFLQLTKRAASDQAENSGYVELGPTLYRKREIQEVSAFEEVVALAISLGYDDERAARYRSRREVFRAIEKLELLQEEITPAAWWEVWHEKFDDRLAISQAASLGKLLSELESELDFRHRVTLQQAREWMDRLTLSGGQEDFDPIVPMLINSVPAGVIVVGE